MEKEESSKRGSFRLSSVILAIVFLLLGVLVGVVIAPYLTEDSRKEDEEVEHNKENNEEKDDELEVGNLTVDSPIVKELFEVFREDKSPFVSPNGANNDINNSLEKKKYIAYTQLAKTDFSEKKCSDLSSTKTSDGASCGEWGPTANGSVIVFSSGVLEAKYKELFGKDAKYEYGNFVISDVSEAYYDNKLGVYGEFYYIGGDEKPPYTYTQTIESGNLADNVLSINTKFSAKSSEPDLFEDEFANITYKFKLESSTDNYIFVSREVN